MLSDGCKWGMHRHRLEWRGARSLIQIKRRSVVSCPASVGNTKTATAREPPPFRDACWYPYWQG
jgi:hypothetical protein